MKELYNLTNASLVFVFIIAVLGALFWAPFLTYADPISWTDAGTYIYPDNYSSYVITDGGDIGLGLTNPALPAIGGIGGTITTGNVLQIYHNTGSTHNASVLDVKAGSVEGFLAAGFNGRVKIGSLSEHDLILMVNNSDRLKIDTAGTLTVSYTGAPNAGHISMVRTDSGQGYAFRLTSDQFRIYDAEADVDRLTIDTAGKVGIGTINPTEKLEVNGNIKIGGDILSDGDICIGNCE